LVIPPEWQRVHLLTHPVLIIVITQRVGHLTQHILEHNLMERIKQLLYDFSMSCVIMVFAIIAFIEYLITETFKKR
jgi:hypothetical protein